MTKRPTLIDHERMIYNITSVYRDADETQHAEGLLWYDNAQTAAHYIAVRYDVPVYLVVAVIAALSPTNKWSRHVTNADALISAFLRGDGIDAVDAIGNIVVERHGAVAGDGPGGGGPDDGTRPDHLRLRRGFDRELDPDGDGFVRVVFDLGISQRGLFHH